MWISLLILKTSIAIIQYYDQSYLIINIDWITYLYHINRSYTSMPCILGTNWHALTSLVRPSPTNFQTRQPHNEGMLYRPFACSTPLSNGEKPYDFRQKIRESLEPRLYLWVKNHEMPLISQKIPFEPSETSWCLAAFPSAHALQVLQARQWRLWPYGQPGDVGLGCSSQTASD